MARENSTNYFLGEKTGPPRVMKSLKDCISAYKNLVLTFKTCLKGEECDLVGYDIRNIHVAWTRLDAVKQLRMKTGLIVRLL